MWFFRNKRCDATTLVGDRWYYCELRLGHNGSHLSRKKRSALDLDVVAEHSASPFKVIH